MNDLSDKNLPSFEMYFGFGNVAVSDCGNDGEKYYIGANGTYSLEVTDGASLSSVFRSDKNSAEKLRAMTVNVIKTVGAEALSAYFSGRKAPADAIDSHAEAFSAELFEKLLQSEELSRMGVRIKSLRIEGFSLRAEDDPMPALAPPEKWRGINRRTVIIAALLSAAVIFISVLISVGVIASGQHRQSEKGLEVYAFGSEYVENKGTIGCFDDLFIVLMYNGAPIDDMENVGISIEDPSLGYVSVLKYGTVYFHDVGTGSTRVRISYKGKNNMYTWECHNIEPPVDNPEKLELYMYGTQYVEYGFGSGSDFLCTLKYDGELIEDMENVTVEFQPASVGRVTVGEKPGELYFRGFNETEIEINFSYKGERLTRIWAVHPTF